MKGSTRFCQAQFINIYSYELFRQLNKEAVWNSLEYAATRLAYFNSELNMLHPFRGGEWKSCSHIYSGICFIKRCKLGI